MRHVLLGLAAAAMLAIPNARPAIVSAATTEEQASELPNVDEAIRYRQLMGLPSSREFVERAAADPEHYSIDLVGIPLSSAEAEELLRRARVEYALGDIGVALRDDPTYGGIYIDQLAGGIGYVLFTGNAEARRADVEAVMPFDVPFELQSVSRSMDDLLALQAAIEKDRPNLVDELGLVSTGISDLENAVIVGVEHPTSAIEEAMTTRYGDDLRFRADSASFADSCTSDHNCRQSRAGWRSILMTTRPTAGTSTGARLASSFGMPTATTRS